MFLLHFSISSIAHWGVSDSDELPSLRASHVVCPFQLTSSRLRRMRTSMLLINLAVADLLVGAFAVPMYMVFQWPHFTLARNAAYVASYEAIDLLTGFASLFSLSVIGLERVFSVFWPHRHRATKKMPYLAAVASCWVLSSLQVLLHVLNAQKIVEFRVFFYNMMFALSFVLVVMDRSQKPLSMREMFPPSMLQNGGRQIRFCHVVSRPASLLAENFSLKTWAQ